VVAHNVAVMRMPVHVPAMTDTAMAGVDGLGDGHPVFRDSDNALHATDDSADDSTSNAAQHAAHRTSHLASGRGPILHAANNPLS